jgi:hypothetical protein
MLYAAKLQLVDVVRCIKITDWITNIIDSSDMDNIVCDFDMPRCWQPS